MNITPAAPAPPACDTVLDPAPLPPLPYNNPGAPSKFVPVSVLLPLKILDPPRPPTATETLPKDNP